MEIKVPARGVHCEHAQCFDLVAFADLMKNSKYRVWRCPFCGRPAHRLEIDYLLVDVLKKADD
jgi:hypothetical protein